MDRLTEIVKWRLLGLGRKLRESSSAGLQDLSALEHFDLINRMPLSFWQNSVRDLTDVQLIDLAQAMTFAERQLRWPGGSVAGASALFRLLVERGTSSQRLDSLSAWMIANTNNPYVPFGTNHIFGATHYSQFKAMQAKRNERREQMEIKERQLEASASAERHARRQRAAAGAAARATPLRDQLIEQLNGMSIGNKLQFIAFHPSFSPQFFPTSIAFEATQQVVDDLPIATRLELARRLKGSLKGPWVKFRSRLHHSLGPVWDKRPWWA